MTAWRKNPELFLMLLAAAALSACSTSPRTELSWNVQDRPAAYGPRTVKLPPVEQHHIATPAEQSNPQYAAATPKPKPRTTPGWYTASNVQPVQPAPRPVYTEPQPVNSTVQFRWPIMGHVLLNYGATESGERNDGINIAAQQGEPVRASASGTVSYCGNELKGYGNLVLIRHDNGYITAYAHVESFLVNRDDHVVAGQVIAYAGQTGDVTQPQLHFEIRGSNQRPVDPRALLPKSMVLASN